MSNLFKFNGVSYGNTETKVIDYNTIISEKISKLQNEIKSSDVIPTNDAFIEGLNAEHVEELLSEDVVADAKETADEIVARAKEEADAISARAKEEAELLKKEAYESGKERGYSEGYGKAMDEFETLKKGLEVEREQMSADYQKKVMEIEPMLVETLLEVFEKVTNVLSVDKKDIVLNLVNDVLSKSEVSKEFLIKVSPEDYEYLQENREMIYGVVSKKVQIEIIEEASFKKNQCVVESDSGIYDCSLDVQMKNLIETIKILSCTAE